LHIWTCWTWLKWTTDSQFISAEALPVGYGIQFADKLNSSDLDPKLHNNSLQLYIFETNEGFWLIFGGRMYQGTMVCRAKDSCWCDLGPWSCDLQTKLPSAAYLLNESSRFLAFGVEYA
jgi:hypothetical protein